LSDEIALTPDGERALAEAQRYCGRMHVAIMGPEHLLAGALLVLGQSGHPGVPAPEALEAALMASQGSGTEPLAANVMFGSAAREAINFTAGGVRGAGGTDITALAIAAGTIASGEVGPMFFGALGTTREALLSALSEGLG
jgi:hypothetical protein